MAGGLVSGSYLEQLLQIHWLRPETALWRTVDCILMEKHGGVLDNAVDLGCGDGTLSFIMAGGKHVNYDVFEEVSELQKYNSGADIHNSLTKKNVNIDVSNLRYQFEYGVDHKDGLISKAKRYYPFYQNTKVSDLDNSLPFQDESFKNGFSNIFYWLKDLNYSLTEIRRVLKKDGMLYLFVPNYNFKQKAWLYYSAPHEGEKAYLNFFDRGYGSLIHHCYRKEEWASIFQKNNFKIEKHVHALSNPVMDVWNVGTRPISPLLISMANRLPLEQRKEVREEWVKYFSDFCRPILDKELSGNLNEENSAFHFFALRKHD
jgi:SAM-dependent methyltransferase